ncbi:aspartic proteinase PCS1-like [Telopea speciosissima]|uniref:aspartic proteinase PCS1-like n=1 Tax=Telopea speciosissima TaxID=54955 RepID=UPI001CC76283|nr:aspartic proteinase PCS1-like [Telopea speciosissima]
MATVLTVHLFFFLFILSQSCFSTSSKQSRAIVVLPLKTQIIPSSSVPKAPNQVSFHHNVSLTASLTVGNPPQNVSMVIDTGSELSWLHCNKTPNLLSTYDRLRSSSYSTIPCSSPTCTNRTRDLPIQPSCDSRKLCHVTLAYADASSSEGNLAFDTFRIGSSAAPGTIFGCMDSGFSSTTQEDSKTTGLMGMNRGALSFVSQMGFQKFSYCISDRNSWGVLLLGGGGGNGSGFPWLGPLNYTPLIQISTPLPYFDRAAYTVQLEGIKVSDKLLPLPKSVFEPDHTGAGQTMVDSGTQFTFLLGSVYSALRNEFLQQMRGVLTVLEDSNFVFQGTMDLCFRVPLSRPSLPALPTVSLVFRGAEMRVFGESLLYKVDGEVRGRDQVYCFTFGNSDLMGVEAYIIGHHHQQNLWMEFDLQNSRVGLAPVSCALASQRLGKGI